MIKYTLNLKKEVEKKIREIDNSQNDILKKSLSASQVLGDSFIQLKEFIIGYDFKNENEEIHFFKEIKPSLFKHLIYWRKFYNIEMNKPISDYPMQITYYKGELESIQKYTQKRFDFYRYYRQGATHLDKMYFTRSAFDHDQYLESFYYERDPIFSTLADFKVTKILANDMIQVYIMQEIENLERCNKYNETDFPKTKLTWLASKTDLIELIYSLDALKIFGNVTRKQLSQYFQKIFNVDLDDNISRSFNEMKTRNRNTSFIDRLKEALLKKIKKVEYEKN